MKPRREDTFRGTALSVLVHAVILAALLFSWRSTQKTESAGGDAGIEASMVKFGDLPADVQAAITGAPQPMAGAPVPAPEEAVPVETQPAEVSETLPEPTPEPETAKPAPPKPEPVKPELTQPEPAKPELRKPEPKKPEPQKPEPAKPEPVVKPVAKPVQTPKPMAPAPKPAHPAKATAAPTTQPAGAAKARADAMARMRAEQLKDIAGGSTATAAGNPKGQSTTGTSASVGKGSASGSSTGNQKRWLDAVAKAIERQWLRPDGIPKDQACPIRIRIIPGGEVISASVQPSCPYSAAAKASVQDAVMKASPLPFKGFENDYARDFTVNFYPSK